LLKYGIEHLDASQIPEEEEEEEIETQHLSTPRHVHDGRVKPQEDGMLKRMKSWFSEHF
jgi:hypothetical protein